MAINVVVAQKKQIHISTNATSTAIVTNNPVTLKETPTLLTTTPELSIGQLMDVDVSQERDGYTLIFDSASNTYVSKPFSVDVGVAIDGGTF